MDAFGAAAAALQFGVTLFQATQTLEAVLKGKSSEPVVTMKMLAKTAEGECDAFLRNYPNDSTPAVRDARMIAQQGKDVCGALLKKIAKMHPEKKNPKTVVWALGTIMWSKDELAELQRGLSDCMQALERFLSQQDRAAVDAALKKAEKALASHIEAKGDKIIALHAKTSAQADDRWSQMVQLANAEKAKRSAQKKVKLLLDALAFPGMEQRYTAVSAADKSTFRWIFGGHDNDHLRDRFSQWLSSGNGVFHIAGKPGSGKSTFMKHVYENPATTRMLEQWAAGKKLIQAACFFWKPGDNMLQKTMMGLIRTLLHGMIVDSHSVAEMLFPEVWGAAGIEEKVEISLSDAAMQEAFQRLVDGETGLAEAGFRYCFFIDGLDEYGDASNTIVQLVRMLTCMAQNGSGWLKICASSREYPEITEKLAADEEHRLTLQDLTHGDITALVDQRLQRAFPSDDYSANKELMKLHNAIIRRAEGVFLWVALVLGIIDEEAELGTPVRELLGFVEVQHDNLNDFFETVIARIEKRNRRKAAILFHHTLLSQEAVVTAIPIVPLRYHSQNDPVFSNSLIWYMFLLEYPATDSSGAEDAFLARCEELQELLQTPDILDARLRETAKRVERYSEGLLTVRVPKTWSAGALVAAEVGLTHRSIHEFLTRLLATRWKDAIAAFNVAGAFARMLLVRLPQYWASADDHWHTNAENLLESLFRLLIAAGPDRIEADQLHEIFELAEAFAAQMNKFRASSGEVNAASTAATGLCHEYLNWRRRTPHAQIQEGLWSEMLSRIIRGRYLEHTKDRFLLTATQLFASGAHASAEDARETPWIAIVRVMSLWHSNPRIRRTLSGLLEIFIQNSDEVDGALPMLVWLSNKSAFVEVKAHSSQETAPVMEWIVYEMSLKRTPFLAPADEAIPGTESLAEFMARLGLPAKLVALAEAREPAAARARRGERLLSAEGLAKLRG